ncbi:MAG TPA: hypothetical protein VNH53_07350 [Sphingomicrobium sp.]|nr:hypothetical protein [Sphingomicrobium sp.]
MPSADSQLLALEVYRQLFQPSQPVHSEKDRRLVFEAKQPEHVGVGKNGRKIGQAELAEVESLEDHMIPDQSLTGHRDQHDLAELGQGAAIGERTAKRFVGH